MALSTLAKVAIGVGAAGAIIALASTAGSSPKTTPTPAPGGTDLCIAYEGTISVDGFAIRYLQIMVGGAKPTDNVPVVVFFHSRESKPESYVNYAKTLSGPARVVLPAGPGTINGKRVWFTLRGASDDQVQLAAQMRWTGDLVAKFLRQLRECTPGNRLPIVTGFSQGASMAYLMTSQHPGDVRSGVGIAGWLPAQLWSAAMKPTVAIHGFTDATVPYAPTSAWALQMVAQGAPLDWRGVPGGHSPTAQMLSIWRAAVDAQGDNV